MEQKYFKQFVDMDVLYTKEGKIIPRILHWPDGTIFEIDKVLDVRPGASLKVGGAGLRFTCRIEGREKVLYLVDNQWFVEAKASG